MNKSAQMGHAAGTVLVMAVILICMLFSSCGKENIQPQGTFIPTSNSVIVEENCPDCCDTCSFVHRTVEVQESAQLSADTLKVRFWITNDNGTMHVRNIVINPATAHLDTTTAIQLNGDYLVATNTSETFTITEQIGQYVRSTIITVTNLGNGDVVLAATQLHHIDAPNAVVVNVNTFQIAVNTAYQFRMVSLPPWLTAQNNASTNSQ